MSADLITTPDAANSNNMGSASLDSSDFESILQQSIQRGASDIHVTEGQVVSLRVGGEIQSASSRVVDSALFNCFLDERLSLEQRKRFAERGAIDGVLAGPANNRFRFNLYKSGGRHSLALRHLQNRFFGLDELGLSDQLYQLCDLRDGLVLVAGPTGSGKSTTLATLINHINENRNAHIITIEDPVEFTHSKIKSIVNQRQVGCDTVDFNQALLDALRQDPDVILVGEIRDLDTIRTAITAAETGHLVFATVHASDCMSAIERLVSVFPGDQQQNIQHLLSTTLRAVVAQHLLVSEISKSRLQESDPRASRNRVLASEVLRVNQAVSNLISGGNLKQIQSVLETGTSEGMYTMDKSLAKLLRQRLISLNTAKSLARNPESLQELSRKV